MTHPHVCTPCRHLGNLCKGTRGHIPGAGVQVDLKDLESATVLAYEYIVSSPHLMKGALSRQALKDFADLTANAHPTKLCAPHPTPREQTHHFAWRATQSSAMKVNVCRVPSTEAGHTNMPPLLISSQAPPSTETEAGSTYLPALAITCQAPLSTETDTEAVTTHPPTFPPTHPPARPGKRLPSTYSSSGAGLAAVQHPRGRTLAARHSSCATYDVVHP